ncbi:hypothetical protein [Petroclostridium sp. X23]|uniref:hypothetical protein n=1 Tax=Petroclostridium sp. X23 TaxID=3045146 RepID=UPI0024ACA773|nr:hypothetical protein [Petroclostridium sp. X23]WHH58367.1 hypothetical protein QKW49_21595 [Petroclostridium sp. X23]
MARIASNQYLLQQSAKEQWHFFHLPSVGICYKKKSENQWNDYEILLKNGEGDFDVTQDARDNIHLVCQDKLGSIIYLMYNGQQWHKYTILQSKTNRAYAKHFKIVYVNKWINLFYIIDYKDKSLLIHHMLDNSNVPPNVIDYVIKNERPFSISVDNSDNIHVYYQSSIDSERMGYRIYLWSKKTWTGFTAIDQQDRNVCLPYTLIDRDDNIHLVYLKKNEKYYDILYTRKPFNSFDKALWDKASIIYARCPGGTQPVMFKTEGKLWILWQQDIKVYSSSSDDDGITWSRASQFIAGRYGNISLFGCRLPPASDKKNIICDLCYGYSTNSDINLYLLSNLLERLPSKSMEPEYKSTGFEVEEFAASNRKSFAPSSFDPAGTSAPTGSIAAEDFSQLSSDPSKAAELFRSSSGSSPSPSSSGMDSVENTKLKIMLNMLQEDLTQIKKKLLELNQISKFDKDLKKDLDVQHRSEIEELKENFQELLMKIEHIEDTQKNIINSNITRIDKEIAALKRKSDRKNFEDLIKKALSDPDKQTAGI